MKLQSDRPLKLMVNMVTRSLCDIRHQGVVDELLAVADGDCTISSAGEISYPTRAQPGCSFSLTQCVVWVLSSGKASTSPISMPYCFGCDCQGDGFGEAP